MISTGSEPELLAEVLRSSRQAFTRFPGLRVVERPGWRQLIAPDFKQGGFNEVSLAVLTPDEADAVIDATLEEYRRLGIRFRWTVGPDSAPEDLASRLAGRGLKSHWTQAMALPLPLSLPTALTTPTPTPTPTPTQTQTQTQPTAPVQHQSEVQVEEVLDPAGVALFTEVMARGWQVDPAPLHMVHLLGQEESPRRQRLFLARRKGALAGVGSYVGSEGTAYLMGAVVLPEQRRTGVYRALVEARLADASKRGLRLATSLAMEETSAPLLLKLGFACVGRLPVFVG